MPLVGAEAECLGQLRQEGFSGQVGRWRESVPVYILKCHLESDSGFDVKFRQRLVFTTERLGKLTSYNNKVERSGHSVCVNSRPFGEI